MIANYPLPQHSMQHMNFIGQRADKIVVEDATVGEDGAIYKDVNRYTVTCPECDCVGRYDERGDIICDGCGMVLGGEPVVPTEHGTGEREDAGGDNMSPASRGLGRTDTPPVPDPATDEDY